MLETVQTLIDFIRGIGLETSFAPITEDTFLPGLLLSEGRLVIDPDRLRYPGDILHEAGHLAVMPGAIRKGMSGDLDHDPIHAGGEMMAIAWSYAACIFLHLDPRLVFHEQGYGGGGREIAENFAAGRYFGVSLLQWQGMTYESARHAPPGTKPFPHMISWLCRREASAEAAAEMTQEDISIHSTP